MARRGSTKRRAARSARQSHASGRLRHVPPAARAWPSVGNGLTPRDLVERGPAWLWPYGLLALLVAVLVWPMWSTPGLLVMGEDALLQHYPWQVLWRDSLAAGEFPFWNPYILSGTPAFANPQAGYAYLPHWLLLWAPALPALNWTIGLHMVLAGLTAAWCAGRLGASKEGQFLSGAAYALGSATTARLVAGHLAFLEANAWLPLATGLAIQIRQRHAVIWLALAVAMMALAGQPEMALFAVWWLPLWALLAALIKDRSLVIGALVRVGLGLGLGFGLTAIQFLPTAALYSVSNRQAGFTADFLTLGSLPPWYLLATLAPDIFGNPLTRNYWPGDWWEWHERLFYIGFVPLVAAVRAPGRWRWVCWGCAAVAVALAFGRYAPWYAWVQALVPGYGSFRVPSKHLGLAALALALAAGLGIERLRGRRLAMGVGGAALVVGLASVSFGQWFPLFATLLGGSERLASSGVQGAIGGIAVPSLLTVAVLLVLLAGAALLPGPWAVRVQVVLAVLELGFVLRVDRTKFSDPQPLLREAQPLRGHARAAVVGQRGPLLAQFGPLLRITQPAGYSSLFSNAYSNLITGHNEPVLVVVARADDPVLPLLGVETVFEPGKPSVPPRDPPQPAAWVARCVWPGTALEVREPDFPRNACITRAAATVRERPVPAGQASVLGARSGWLMVRTEGPGWLVTYQPWYPGWSALVDGAPTPTEPVDSALVGVSLPPGPHTVVLSYRPAWLEIGAGVTLLAALALLGWSLLERRRVIGGDSPPGMMPSTSGA